MSWMDLISCLLDERAIFETSAIAIGSSFSALFYFLYRKNDARADKVKNANIYDLEKGVADMIGGSSSSRFPYALINGYVQAAENPLHCNADKSIEGVIWKKTTTEHKDVYQSYIKSWSNTTHEVSSVSDSVPFKLQGSNGLTSVRITDPFESSWFDDTIDVVHERFHPTPSSAMDSIVGYMSGDKLKGYTETERMLKIGTKLCVFGDMVIEDGILKLKPPSGSRNDYIITKLSQSDIVAHIQRNAKIWKIIALLLAAASATGLYFMIRRLRRRYKELKDEQRTNEELNEIRRQRTTVAGRLNRERLATGGQESCVVCLTNPRECVLLDCGHICVCVDCLEAIQSPKECPMCRSRIVRTVPLYNV